MARNILTSWAFISSAVSATCSRRWYTLVNLRAYWPSFCRQSLRPITDGKVFHIRLPTSLTVIAYAAWGTSCPTIQFFSPTRVYHKELSPCHYSKELKIVFNFRDPSSHSYFFEFLFHSFQLWLNKLVFSPTNFPDFVRDAWRHTARFLPHKNAGVWKQNITHVG